VIRGDRLHRAASPVLADLHRATGLAVHMSALVGADVLHLEQLVAVGSRAADWPAGSRTPAVHTAPGRALLARLSPLARSALDLSTPPTAYGIRSRRQWESELVRIAERGGIAVDAQGCIPGVTVIAAAIGPEGAAARTALSVSGPAEAIRVERVVSVVRTAAMDIWCAASDVARLHRRPAPRVRAGRVGMAG
jgi:DNA-binding IclR family transcriptional regulator